MAIEVIGEIIPKNNGKFPIVSAPNVSVTTSINESTDITQNEGNQLRYSYTVGDIISLDGHTAYKINRVGVRADAGTTVRFSLYAVGDGVLTHLATLGSAVTDADTMAAVLTLEGHVVRQDNTIILAFADTASIHCTAMPEGMSTEGLIQYADAAYAEGAEIPCTSGTTAAGDTFTAMFARSIDFLKEQRLDEYVKGTDARLEQTIYPVEEGVSGQTISPERHYVFGSVTGLTVALEQINDGRAHEYCFEFEPAGGFSGLTITPSVRWMAEPQYPAGKKCLVCILRGMAVMGCG